MRVKKARAMYHVANDYLTANPEQARADVRQELTRSLSLPIRGPRGGRYEGFGEITFLGDDGGASRENFHLDVTEFGATRMAKYVRPHR